MSNNKAVKAPPAYMKRGRLSDAILKAESMGLSFSAYINYLVAKDLGGNNE